MHRRMGLLCLGLCLAVVGTARAGSLGTVELRYDSAIPARAATIHLEGFISGQTVWTGQYNLELNPDYQPTGEGQDLYNAADNYIIHTFCADVHQPAPTGSDWRRYDILPLEEAPVGGQNNVTGPMVSQKVNDLRWLYAMFYGQWNDGVGDARDEAAAFELSVWEIVFETTGQYDVYDPAVRGDFYTTSGGSTFAALANSWLGAVENATGPVPDIPLRVLGNETWQDYAVIIPGTGGDPAPEPITLVGVGLGIAGLVRHVRTRRRIAEA